MVRTKQVCYKKTTPTTKLDAPIFISREAETRYKAIASDKTLIPERGFDAELLKQGAYPEYVQQVVRARKWESFCEVPMEAVIPVVREFCANCPGDNPYMVTVRGVSVLTGPPAIRAVYDLEPTTDDYVPLLNRCDEPELLQQVLNRLCLPNTIWTISKEGSYTFKRTRLVPEAKVWYHFLQSHLLPTSHLQTVSRDRAFLLYCILEGKEIDVDQLVYRELCTSIKTTTGSLWFPGLITELCRAAGVKIKGTEERLKISAPITPAIIQRMTGPPASKPKEGPSTSTPGLSSSSAPAPDSANVSQPFADLQHQFATLLLQQQVMWRYMAERDAALAANLMANFPKFTPFPPFPQSVFEMAGTTEEPIPHEASGSKKRKRGKAVIEESEPEQETEEEEDYSS